MSDDQCTVLSGLLLRFNADVLSTRCKAQTCLKYTQYLPKDTQDADNYSHTTSKLYLFKSFLAFLAQYKEYRLNTRNKKTDTASNTTLT